MGVVDSLYCTATLTRATTALTNPAHGASRAISAQQCVNLVLEHIVPGCLGLVLCAPRPTLDTLCHTAHTSA
jgi:hypothetical protein